jgi:diacylglycerol kinase (ATP)
MTARTAILLYNPAAGPGTARRAQSHVETIAAIAKALRTRGLEVQIVPTEGPGTAGAQAAAAHADILFACGGDGTVHEALQGLIALPGSPPTPALGIIPLGTANALARHLNLPLDPIAAATLQLTWQPRSIPIGRLTAEGTATWFTVMAGAGPHAALLYRMTAASTLSKQTLGRTAYYLRSARLFLGHAISSGRTFPTFNLEVVTPDGRTHRLQATSAIAVRVSTLGGLFHGLTTGGRVDSPTLRLIVARPPATLALPLWFAAGWLRLTRITPLLDIFDAVSFRCTPVPGGTCPDIQADGEWLGRHAIDVSLVPNVVRLLMPPATGSAA